jgi:signal transduction histidine kinase
MPDSVQKAVAEPRYTHNPARSLQRRLMLAFALFALCLMTVFTLYALVFAYTVEDQYLEQGLRAEAERQRSGYRLTGSWLQPQDPNTQLLLDVGQFPDDLRGAFLQDPYRREFVGAQGRHYHLMTITFDGGSAWLVAEVSSRLIFRKMRQDVIAILGWSAAMALAAALLIGWWIARRTTLPLSRLADAVSGLQPDQLPQQLWKQSATRAPRDEIDLLARGLDDLVQRVRAFIQREQEFTRDVGHELRTPLCVIRSLCEQVSADDRLDPALRTQLDSVRQSAAQLEQIVLTLLSLARETQMPAVMEPVALLPILERVILEQASLHEDSRLELRLDVPASTCVALNEPVLHMLLSNLIGNALAHAESTAKDARRQVRIDVQQARLCISNAATLPLGGEDFIAFHKREGSAGYGLGLAIVRRLCDRFDVDLRIVHANGQTTASIDVVSDQEAA